MRKRLVFLLNTSPKRDLEAYKHGRRKRRLGRGYARGRRVTPFTGSWIVG